MRIALFTFSYAPVLTGIATGVHTRVRCLLERGHHVFLVHPSIDEQYPSQVRDRRMPGVEEFSDAPRFSSWAYPTRPHPLVRTHPEPRGWRVWSDTELLRGYRPDVVLVEEAVGMHGFSSVFWGGYGRPVGAEYRRLTGTPTVALFETDLARYAEYYFGQVVFGLLRPLLAPMLRRHSRAYNTTFFPSSVLREKYRRLGLTPSEHLPFHGVSCEDFRPDNLRCDPIPGDDRPLLLFVGRIVREKNLDVLFRAFGQILRAVPRAHLAVVGSGADLPRVRRRLAPFKDGATVRGDAFGPELRGWYARADAFLNPSVSENFCTTNLEALASGTPVIAAHAGGNGEQVVPEVNGFLTNPGSAGDLAEKTIHLLREPELRERLARGARQTALYYDGPACAERLEAALAGLLR